ncbi:MAG: glycosyl transferase [Methylotenera sp.]|nr:glycosyl transferase [Methylotenera sp.]
MRFQLDHDWQGNMSSPRARVGEGAKTQLLLVLCVIWVLLGLTGHAPWKPLESISISIVKGIMQGGSLIAPLAAGEAALSSPPLYYLTAALGAKLFSPWLSMHDGARLINAFWMALTLLMVGMVGRELWYRGVGRHATFIMMGTIGLVMSAHSLNVEVANLTCVATGFYALALAKRRPWRASALLGLALGLGFLVKGFLPVLVLIVTLALLPLLFKAWRTKSFAKVVSVAVLIALPLMASWLLVFYFKHPVLLAQWVQSEIGNFGQQNHAYFVRILVWYAWPALPLALWAAWKYRHQLLIKPKFQLIFTFFVVSLVLLGFGAGSKDINALILLLPMVALAAGSVEHLKRGASAALNWFGISLFGLLGFLIWLGWIAMLTGFPAKIKARMQFLSGSDTVHFSWLVFAMALLITIIWGLTCLRAKQTNRSAITNWAVGMTFAWGLLMTLWLPWIDAVKSYAPMFANMQKAMPQQVKCMNSLNVGQSQRLLMHYYTGINLQALEANQPMHCDFYLIQDERGVGRMQPSDEWKLIWRGKRIADRKEGFRLYQRVK